MKLNNLYKFDANILIESGIENSVLKCSSTICDIAREKVTKRDSLLFEQINHIKKPDTGLEEILVIIDYSEYIENHKMDELSSIKCIELKVHKFDNKGFELETESTITVVDFLKSNSMSKDCQIYYINSKITDKDGNNLYETIMPRVFFDFNSQKTILSKLYAYSGTICSDCTLLDDIKFNEDEIVVVDDKQDIELSDCITMVSEDFLYNELGKIRNYFDDYPNKELNEILEFNSCKEFESLFESLNLFDNIIENKTIEDIIIKYHNLERSEKESFIRDLDILIQEYKEIGSKSGPVKWERIKAKNYPFDLNLFDGEGFITKEFCEQLRYSLCKKLNNDKYKDSTSFQIRLPYIKHSLKKKELLIFSMLFLMVKKNMMLIK